MEATKIEKKRNVYTAAVFLRGEVERAREAWDPRQLTILVELAPQPPYRLQSTLHLQIGVCRNAVVCIIMSNTSVWSITETLFLWCTVCFINRVRLCEDREYVCICGHW